VARRIGRLHARRIWSFCSRLRFSRFDQYACSAAVRLRTSSQVTAWAGERLAKISSNAAAKVAKILMLDILGPPSQASMGAACAPRKIDSDSKESAIGARESSKGAVMEDRIHRLIRSKWRLRCTPIRQPPRFRSRGSASPGCFLSVSRSMVQSAKTPRRQVQRRSSGFTIQAISGIAASSQPSPATT
jgi:hypothetical protein